MSTTWEYRVGFDPKTRHYGIYEYYVDHKMGLTGCTADPLPPLGESREELLRDMRRMLKAFDKPTIGVE